MKEKQLIFSKKNLGPQYQQYRVGVKSVFPMPHSWAFLPYKYLQLQTCAEHDVCSDGGRVKPANQLLSIKKELSLMPRTERGLGFLALSSYFRKPDRDSLAEHSLLWFSQFLSSNSVNLPSHPSFHFQKAVLFWPVRLPNHTSSVQSLPPTR